MSLPRPWLTIGNLMVGVWVCAFLLYWGRPLIPIIRREPRLSWLALIPIGFIAIAISMSRAVDWYVRRVEAGRSADESKAGATGLGIDE